MVLVFAILVYLTSVRAHDTSQCHAALGMEDGSIPDEDITASSTFDAGNLASYNARLNKDVKSGAWCPDARVNPNSKEWLEIDLHFVHLVTGLAVQGRFGNGLGKEYTEAYYIEYWRPRLNRWVRYRTINREEILPGNINHYIARKIVLDPPIWLSKIRFIPYSTSQRTVCMRVEIYGCFWSAGIESYTIPKGDRRSTNVELTDRIYDGQLGKKLSGGLGQLVDGKFGGDQIIEAMKTPAWLGWQNESTKDPTFLFEFDKPREFKTVHIFCNNMFKRDIEIFSKVLIWFSIGGQHFQDEPIHFWNVPDKQYEYSRNVSIPLHHRIGRYVRIELKYAARWMLISEVVFDSVPAEGVHNAEAEVKPPIKEKTKRPPKRLATVTTPTEEEDPLYVAIIVGVLSVLAILLAVAVAFFVHRHRHRKCFASPVVKTHRARDTNGRCDLTTSNNKRALEAPSEVKSDEYQEPYQDYDSHPGAGSVLLEMQEIHEPGARNVVEYDSSHYEYAVPDVSAAPPARRRQLPIVGISTCWIYTPNRNEMKARLASMNTDGTLSGNVYYNDNPVRLNRHRVPELPRHRMRMMTKIGDGAFGTIYIAEANNVMEYAGAVIREKRFMVARFCYCNTILERQQFEQDVGILATLCSPYLARVLGMNRNPPFSVVTEYLEHGDLCTFLRNAPTPSHDKLLFIIEQIAAGMKYLEALNFVHRDLAARNIVIGFGYRIKINDFADKIDAFARDYCVVIGPDPLPIRWAAWETVMSGKYSMKSDAWSFAVTMYEIFSLCRHQPYSEWTIQEVIDNLTHLAEDNGLFDCLPRGNAPIDLYEIMRNCWNRDAVQRPSFADMHRILVQKRDGFIM